MRCSIIIALIMVEGRDCLWDPWNIVEMIRASFFRCPIFHYRLKYVSLRPKLCICLKNNSSTWFFREKKSQTSIARWWTHWTRKLRHECGVITSFHEHCCYLKQSYIQWCLDIGYIVTTSKTMEQPALTNGFRQAEILWLSVWNTPLSSITISLQQQLWLKSPRNISINGQ